MSCRRSRLPQVVSGLTACGRPAAQSPKTGNRHAAGIANFLEVSRRDGTCPVGAALADGDDDASGRHGGCQMMSETTGSTIQHCRLAALVVSLTIALPAVLHAQDNRFDDPPEFNAQAAGSASQSGGTTDTVTGI